MIDIGIFGFYFKEYMSSFTSTLSTQKTVINMNLWIYISIDVNHEPHILATISTKYIPTQFTSANLKECAVRKGLTIDIDNKALVKASIKLEFDTKNSTIQLAS